jgi:hypothetical protein
MFGAGGKEILLQRKNFAVSRSILPTSTTKTIKE